MDDIRGNGHTSYLEVVSETAEDTLESARAAAEIGPDYLIGGTLIEPVQEIIAGTGIKFFPYVGQIVGHPCLLRGSIEEIAEDARRAESLGVDGINLLAYRYDGDVDALVEAVVGATSLPVIAAGSVDSPARIQALAERGVWAFTIGTAALDGVLVEGGRSTSSCAARSTRPRRWRRGRGPHHRPPAAPPYAALSSPSLTRRPMVSYLARSLDLM